MARLGRDLVTPALALLLVLLTSDLAYSQDKCRSGCQGASKTFKYADGTTYKYNLEGNIDISLSSAEGQQTTTKLKATVLLTQLPECNQLLRLKDVQVIGPEAKKYSHLVGIEKPIRLNFHDGHVEDVVCAEPDDNQNSLNIKRAVASLFQASPKHSYETDVFGVCPTDVNSRDDGGVVVIQKSKNLNKCGQRESLSNEFLSTTFNLNSEIKSSPLLDGDYTSEQHIKNGILEKVLVTENYLYLPFSIGKNGAQASITTKLQLVGQSKENPGSKVSEPKSIIFENPHPVSTEKVNLDSILNALKDATNTIGQTVKENSANEYINLVKTLRVSSKNDILAVYRQVKAGAGFQDKVGAKRVFLDALFRAGTGETIEVAIELLKNKELTPLEQKILYIRLAFVKHATPGSLNAAAALLDQAQLPREAYLSIGSIAGIYCRQHSCSKIDAINKLSQKLLAKVKGGKPQNRDEEKEQLYALKALGNIGTLIDSVSARLIAIAQDKKEPNRVRVAALETLLTDACKDKIRDAAVSILKDIQQDSEIRIKAYLVLAQCPNGKVATALKALLDTEPSYQVGGFITSHLRNLKATTNPDKELAKQQLSNIVPPNRFPFDIRKYSFNSEFSYAIDTLGLANSIESNVIYSQSSFLPRSLDLNLTADLFGHTFNFLEVSTRQENLDKVLEHYYGPSGVFRTTEPEELFAKGKDTAKNLYDTFNERYAKLQRSRRDVPKAEVDKIEKDIRIKTNELNTDVDVDYSIKLFGSELLFVNVYENVDKFKPEVLIEKFFDHLELGIDKTKNFQESIQSNVLFLDTELSYPTSLGFPLRLAVDGAFSVLFKVEGNIDLQSLISSTADKHLKLKLIPSANIEVAGSLSIDTQVVESGLKVKSSLYTATGTDLSIELSKLKGIDVKFSLPVKEQKIVSANHQILFKSRELGKKEVTKPLKFTHNKDFSICFDNVSPYIGLTFCADIDSPSQTGKQAPLLPFPFSGNAKFSVGIEREDLSEYHLRSTPYAGESNKNGLDFVFEVLGEKRDRKLSVEAEAFLYPEAYVRGAITAPQKTLSAEARIINSNNEKSILGKLRHDNEEFYAKAGVAVSGSPQRQVYKPLLDYKLPGGQQAQQGTVEGTVVVEQGGSNVKYIFNDVKLLLPNQKNVLLKGSVARENSKYISDITVSDGEKDASLKAKVQLVPQFTLDAEFKNSVNPQANVNLKAAFKKTPTEVETSLELVHGHDLNSKTNKLVISSNSEYKFKDYQDYKFKSEGKFSYPLIGTEATGEIETSPKKLKYDVDLKYNKVNIGSELELEVSRKEVGDYDLEFEIYGMGNKLEIKSQHDINGDDSKIENEVELNGKKAELKGTIKHHFKPDDIDIGANLVLKVPNLKEAVKFNGGLVLNPDKADAVLKVSAGGNINADVLLKATKDGNANGNLKVFVKDFIEANGQLKASKGSGTANVVVDIQKLNKKLKADSTFKISDPIYNVVVHLYPDVNKDPQNKITFSTESKLTPTLIDTKNYVEAAGKRLEGNVKAAREQSPGHETGELQVEITLPTDHYYLLKINRNIKTVNDIINGQGVLVLESRENKNAPGLKITSKGVLKDSNPKKHIIDYTNNIVIDLPQGKSVNADVAVKHSGHEEKKVSEASLKVSGSALPHPVELSTSAQYKERVGNYKIVGKCGSQSSISVSGNYDLYGQGKPVSGDINVEVITPNAIIRNVRLSSSGLAKKPETPEDHLELKGKFALFIDDDGSKPDATLDVKTEGELQFGRRDGKLQGTLNFQKEPPISVAFGYGISDEQELKKLNANLELKTGKGRDVKTDITISKEKENEYVLDLLLDAPEARGSKFHFYNKKSSDGKVHKNGGTVEVNGKKYVIANELVLSDITPVLDLSLQFPDGKKDEIVLKINTISSNKGSGQIKIAIPRKDFLLEGDVDAYVESPDNFNIKGNINSPTLKINKYAFEAQTKAAKGGNRILVSLSSDGQNILSGSTSYKHRVEGDKTIVEGAGSFKLKEENKAANFKFIRQSLDAAKYGEQGIQVSFNGGLGPKAIDAELKLTNKQFKVLNSYCEEKKQCSHIELDSKITQNDVSIFNHEIEIAIDLRNLGFPHEFGLKGVTTRKDLVFVHTVDIHLQNKNNKYQYSVYVQPTEAGVTLTTPKRVVSAEAKLQKEKGKLVPIKGDISLYFDKKNQPNQKTSLSGILNYDHSKDSGNVHAEVKFTNPSLAKDLQVLYNAKYDIPSKTATLEFVIDVFSKANQKIVVTGKAVKRRIGNYGFSVSNVFEAKSQGLKIDIKSEENVLIDFVEKKTFQYDFKIIYNLDKAKYISALQAEADQKHALLLLSTLNKELLKVDSRFQLNKNVQIVDTTTQILGVKPIVSHLEVKNFNTVKFYTSRKDNPNEKIELNAGFIPSQISDFRLEVIKNGQRKDLLHASVKLDEANFLKSDYGVSAENIKQLVLVPIKNDIETFLKESKATLDSATKEFSDQVNHINSIAKKSLPNFKPFLEYHKKELEKLREEFVSDKTLKELEEFFKSTFGAVVKTFNEILAQVSDVTEKVVANLQTQFAQITESINKDLLPKVRDIAKNILDASYTILEQFTNLFFTYLAKISQIIDAHQDELKHIATYISSISQDVVRFLAKVFEQTRDVVVKESQQIYNEIKNLPIAEELKNRYNEITSGVTVSEGIINTIKDFATTLKDALPNESLKSVVTAITDYIEKKLKREPVDDVAAIEAIVKTIADALKAVLQSIQTDKDFSFPTKAIPVSFNFIHNLPRLVAVKFSPLNYLLKNDLPDIVTSFRTAISFDLRDFILPQRLFAIVAQGQHIFTFDGKHITFPGKCNYLLAGDAENGNFSLVGTYTNGILTAITLSVNDEIVTLKKGRQALLNNAAADLPISTPHISAYSLYESVHLKSKAGILVVCGPELVVCGVHISGFYHGQLKGLLGNGNNEPYDDFTLPNGKIVTSPKEFGNSYKTSGGCPDVSEVGHTDAGHKSQPSCEKLFDLESPLRFCSPFVDPANFKEACNHGLHAGVPDTERAIAVAYAAACNHKNVWIRVPDEFLQCQNSDKPYDVFTKFSVKLPGKAADIVIIVDQNKSNEEIYKNILQPLVPQVVQELNSKGINDVEFHLIGFGGVSSQWPSHFTHGGKLTFKGKLPNVKFYDQPKKPEFQTGNEKVDSFLKTAKSWLHDLSLASGCNVEFVTYKEAISYPFRANAAKAIIVARGTPCEQGRFVLIQKLSAYLFNSKELSLNLIVPFPHLKVKDPKEAKNVIGFNSRNAFTLSDTKKKQGTPDLHKQLDYDDFCVDFTTNHRGNVFVANNILAAKAAAKKQAVQIAAHNIVQSITSVEQGLDCECKPISPYSALNQCHVVYTKDRK
ncbi:apolipophorins isoform X3 [Agrilus planipennis]|uniref:Apolipophorins isoform X3 n=1 Tax=Agrilus planipennis TaxID=224129 RepID=A0A7F5RNP6_AGRPL|nr:apolipophorins isoform X3 [Agrilus planipennis]